MVKSMSSGNQSRESKRSRSRGSTLNRLQIQSNQSKRLENLNNIYLNNNDHQRTTQDLNFDKNTNQIHQKFIDLGDYKADMIDA